MHRSLNEVSEAILWDNLKRKANETLQKIEASDLQRKLKIFKTPRFLVIHNLLGDIGKEFFRIFLFKTIETELKKGQTVENTLKDFHFFFWPGYTTLEGKRIFIEGNQKPGSEIHRYFTGIGNKKMNNLNDDTFYDYFLRGDNRCELLSDIPNLWTYHIPATLAFDSIMNQFYLNQDGERHQQTFVAGSTHHWKSIQKSSKGGKEIYLPMHLKKDSTEFRILEVNTNKKFSYTVVSDKKNTISINIPEKQIGVSGDIIAQKLSSQNIPVRLDLKDKKSFIPWPIGVKETGPNPVNNENSKLFDLQKKAYSFWISETLNHGDEKPNYEHIKSIFKDSPYSYLAERIKPFQERIAENPDILDFTEIYYKNWYTLFLDSYSEKVDLGTGMFLTSHSYDEEFLMKCSHWIRWIYNELRLLEAAADVEVKQKDQDERDISHDLTSHVGALRFFIDTHIINNPGQLDDNLQSIYDFLYSSINSIVIVEKSKYEKNENIFNIKDEITNTLSVFAMISADFRLYNKVFKGVAQDENVFKLFQHLRHFEWELFDYDIKADLNLIRMLLKDILENLVKHSRLVDPKCLVTMEEENGKLHINFLNNNIPEDDTIQHMRSNSFPLQKNGWKKIVKNLKRMGWSYQVDIIKYEITDYFRIKIKNHD